MSVIKPTIVLVVISVMTLGFLIFPAKVEKIVVTRDVTTENYKIASNYRNVSWNIVVPLDPDTFILEKDGNIKFIKIINKSVKPLEIRMIKIYDKREPKDVDNKHFKVEYSIYECKPMDIKLAFINVTSNGWKLGTLGVIFRKDRVYVIGDTFANGCSPVVDRSYNCSKLGAISITKIKIDDIIIINKIYSNNKLNISLKNSIVDVGDVS